MVNSVPEGPGNDSYNDSDMDLNNRSHKLLCGSNVLKSAHGSDNKVTLYIIFSSRYNLEPENNPTYFGMSAKFLDVIRLL